MRNMFKKAVAYVCALAMVLTGFSGISVVANAEEAAPKKYVELSFADLGLMDGTHTEIEAATTLEAVSSMDGIAVTGQLKMTPSGANMKLGAAAATIDYTPIMLMVDREGNLWAWDDLSIDTKYNVVLSENKANTWFTIRICFDYVGTNDLKVTYYVDDEDPIEVVYKDFVTGVTYESKNVAKAGLTLRPLAASGSMDVKSVVNCKDVTLHDYALQMVLL